MNEDTKYSLKVMGVLLAATIVSIAVVGYSVEFFKSPYQRWIDECRVEKGYSISECDDRWREDHPMPKEYHSK